MSLSVDQSGEATNDDELEAVQPLEVMRPYGRRGRGIQSNVDQSGEGENASQSYANVQLESGYGLTRRRVYTSVEQSSDGISASQLNSLQPLKGPTAYGRRTRGVTSNASQVEGASMGRGGGARSVR